LKRVRAVISILLSGCTIAGKGVVTDVAAVPAGKGLVVFSTGAAQTSTSFATRVTLVEAASMKRYDKVAMSIDYPFASDFPDMHANVRTLTLPPGKYYLVPHAGNPAMLTTRAPIYSFEVKANMIEYLGNIYLDGHFLALRNDFKERDIGFFVARNPALRDIPIEVDSLRIDRYLNDVNGATFNVQGVIWEAPR
jgi:hypothetical protein